MRDQIDLDKPTIYEAIRQIATSWRNPPGTLPTVLERLERDGLIESAAALRESRAVFG